MGQVLFNKAHLALLVYHTSAPFHDIAFRTVCHSLFEVITPVHHIGVIEILPYLTAKALSRYALLDALFKSLRHSEFKLRLGVLL